MYGIVVETSEPLGSRGMQLKESQHRGSEMVGLALSVTNHELHVYMYATDTSELHYLVTELSHLISIQGTEVCSGYLG